MADARIEELKTLLPRCMVADWVRLGARAARLFRDRLHPDKHDALLERLLAQARQSAELRELRRLSVPRPAYPEALPITARKDDIVAAIRAHQVVVLAGETGSGKTTQIPKMCLEAGLGIEARIGCTQPRRVAALSISRRIAEELGVTWGREVGCKIRFDDRSSPETFIKLMTDGILLAETQGDPLLSDYNALIIDEAHERSLNIDFLLGYLKGLLVKRADLKLIITSATIDTAAFAQHFGNAPVIEVSGRTYPVEVIYAPAGEFGETAAAAGGAPDEDPDFITAAVRATERVFYESSFGDVLIFLPGERDIRECGDQLAGRLGREAELVPLYGRLSAGDQQRVFAPADRRKVVIATNIAETSLTIPGIRFVIDAGLARLSRYNARTRTRRLPIEPVSQSSANQRKGRAGRVQDGVCIRLYSEDDFNARPPFTQPEIQRSNLAEVILRMKAFRLGDIETFPFLNPPTPAAIQGGYTLLHELGALDEHRGLTPLGHDLARLPIDPTLGRMLLQSQREHATRELLIIASGLSIQDPRERPLDQRAAADAAHQRLQHPHSDFLTLLNVWNAVHDQWESLRTQGQRRRFCKQHFLSYTRMREWQDLHAQLHGAFADLGAVWLDETNDSYEAVHRSILAGLLGHVATRLERNTYEASGKRRVMVFPGSALFDRAEKPAGKRGEKTQTPPESDAAAKTQQPRWIVAGELVETSQLFARTVAGIEPRWIAELAPHLCRVTHQNPHWSPEAGRVLVEEIVRFNGLEIHRRQASYANINPKAATALFIRAALVEENLIGSAKPEVRSAKLDDTPQNSAFRTPHSALDESAGRFPFLAHNRKLREKIETWQTRVRHRTLDVDQALADFYAKRLDNVSSVHELNRFVQGLTDAGVLCATEADLVGDQELRFDADAFPEAVLISGQPVEVSYAYAPGEEHDGATLRLPAALARSVSPAAVQWAVPGLRSEQAAELLRSLPGTLRKQLLPLQPKADEIARHFAPTGPSLCVALSQFVRTQFRVEVPPDAWRLETVPAHLRPRVEVIGQDQRALGAGRDFNSLRTQLEQELAKASLELRDDSPLWSRAAREWERFGLTGWTFGDLPERLTLAEGPGLPLYAWPGLAVEDGTVSVRLFRAAPLAREASAAGFRRLVELALQKDLAWLEKDLRAVSGLAELYAPLGSRDELLETAVTHLRRHLLPAAAPATLTRPNFDTAVAQAKARLPGLAQQFLERVELLLKQRREVAQRVGTPAPAPPPRPRNRTLTDFSQLGAAPVKPAASSPLAGELVALVPPRFLESVPYDRLPHLPRYLKALLLRAERAATNPLKDRERALQVAPYALAVRQLLTMKPVPEEAVPLIEELRWLVEEFKVSVFAQELGTAVKVSPKRLDEQLDRLRLAGIRFPKSG